MTDEFLLSMLRADLEQPSPTVNEYLLVNVSDLSAVICYEAQDAVGLTVCGTVVVEIQHDEQYYHHYGDRKSRDPYESELKLLYQYHSLWCLLLL